MSNTLKFGNGNWATKEGSALAYNDENNNFKPLPFNFERASSATVVNKEGLIETVGAGMPRIDYKDDSEGALLLEPSRTNILPYSEDFSNSNWINQSTDTTLSLVSSGSPDGGAFYRCTSGSNGGGRIVDIFSGSLTGGVFSIYAKGSGSLRIDLFINGGGNINNTITLTSEWKKYEVYNPQTNSSGDVSIRFFANSVADIFGAQVESGSYATSYIPTSGSAVTRLADVCNNGGNDQVINSTEGVLYAEIAALADDGTFRMISVSDGTNDNRVRINYTATNEQIQSRVYVGGAIVSSINKSNFTDITDLTKIALSYKQNEIKFYINGELIGTDTSATMPPADTFNVLNFDGSNGSNNFYGNVKDVRVYNTALTDQELKRLTQ